MTSQYNVNFKYTNFYYFTSKMGQLLMMEYYRIVLLFFVHVEMKVNQLKTGHWKTRH